MINMKKNINFKLDVDLHDWLKHYIITNNTTITEVLTKHIKELKNPITTITKTKKSEKPKIKEVSKPKKPKKAYNEDYPPEEQSEEFDQSESFDDYLKKGKHKGD